MTVEKSKHPGSRLKHKLGRVKAWRLRIFRDALILVFVNKNCCLCICFTELCFFYWLLVVSLVILIAVPIVFSRSVNIACRSTQNAARIKRFWRLHIDKTIKKNIISSLLCWSVTLIMFIQTLYHSRTAIVRTGWPNRWFWKFFYRFR